VYAISTAVSREGTHAGVYNSCRCVQIRNPVHSWVCNPTAVLGKKYMKENVIPTAVSREGIRTIQYKQGCVIRTAVPGKEYMKGCVILTPVSTEGIRDKQGW
jgi:hypothetical protein